ncbi:MAG: tetratricopeptide repeat protein, partial [Planctomycetota bacterium]
KEMQNDFSDALLLYKRAISKGQSYKSLADLLTSAARCCLQTGQLEEAESYANQAIENDPDFLVALIELGNIEDARNCKEKADKFFGECLRISNEKKLPFPKVSKKIRARAEAYLRQ